MFISEYPNPIGGHRPLKLEPSGRDKISTSDSYSDYALFLGRSVNVAICAFSLKRLSHMQLRFTMRPWALTNFCSHLKRSDIPLPTFHWCIFKFQKSDIWHLAPAKSKGLYFFFRRFLSFWDDLRGDNFLGIYVSYQLSSIFCWKIGWSFHHDFGSPTPTHETPAASNATCFVLSHARFKWWCHGEVRIFFQLGFVKGDQLAWFQQRRVDASIWRCKIERLPPKS